MNFAERRPWSPPRADDDAVRDYSKGVPESVLIIGASGHIGGPCAHHLKAAAPEVRLRLATSKPERVAALQRDFPDDEIVVADLNDVTTLIPAFEGIEGALVVQADFMHAKKCMVNLTAAADHAGTLKHVLRIMGENPEVKHPSDLPARVTTDGDCGLAMAHAQARQVLELVSDYLPITFVNGFAYFMDDILTLFGGGIREKRLLASPFDRVTTWVDTRDIGVAAANLLLSDDIRDIGTSIGLNNGSDYMFMSEAAEVISAGIGETVGYDGTPAGFKRANGKSIGDYWAPGAENEALEAALGIVADYFEWEQQVENIFVPTRQLELILGRKPVTLAEWVAEHREMLTGEAPVKLSTKWTERSPERVHDAIRPRGSRFSAKNLVR